METPSYFNQNIKELNQRYFLIIDEIVKTFPKYKSSPKLNSFEEPYNKNINNLRNLQAEYFLLKNNLNKNTDELQKEIKQIDDVLYVLEEEIKVLTRELRDLNNSDNAASGMFTDSRNLYNIQFFGNTILFIIIFSMGVSSFSSTYCPTFICIDTVKSALSRIFFNIV